MTDDARPTTIDLASEPKFPLGGMEVRPATRELVVGGQTDLLEPRVMQVLVALIRAGGRILTRDDLLMSCWHGVVVGEDAITRVMGRLRRLADGIGEGQFKLETVTKVGYRLVSLSPARENAPTAGTIAHAQPARGKPPSPDVAAQIPHDPSQIALHGERRHIYAMVTDLQGFGELAHGLQPEMVASVLNAYLDRLSRAVLEHGGTIDKIIGDAVLAFWGAPVARPDDGERAARAAIATWRVGEAFRTTPIGDHPPLGRTRVGLHRGDAIVGAFGGQGRITYSALGDAVTMAFGLESANRSLNTDILTSREAISPSVAGVFRAMGRIGLRGRSTPVEVFEAALDFPPEARAPERGLPPLRRRSGRRPRRDLGSGRRVLGGRRASRLAQPPGDGRSRWRLPPELILRA